MKYLQLVWAALLRHKARTLFTLLSVVAAFLLFGLLDSVRGAFAGAGSSVAGLNRLVTVSKISFTLQLPKSLLERIQAVPGVADVTYANWFGGIYQDQKNFFPNQAVAANYLDAYPGMEASAPPSARHFATPAPARSSGRCSAKKFHWKVGDKIPLQATIFPQKNGSNTWTFDLVGIYTVADPQQTRAGECAAVQLGLFRRGARLRQRQRRLVRDPRCRSQATPIGSRRRSTRCRSIRTTRPRPRANTPSSWRSSASSATSA